MAMSAALSNEEVQVAWANLAEEVRTGVLLTLRDGRPFGSHVPYVFGEHCTRAYIHVSRLALHTEHLLRDPRVGLFVSEPDRPGKNPLSLRRMNLQGEAALLNVDASEYAEVKERYLARFPQSAMMFGLSKRDDVAMLAVISLGCDSPRTLTGAISEPTGPLFLERA